MANIMGCKLVKSVAQPTKASVANRAGQNTWLPGCRNSGKLTLQNTSRFVREIGSIALNPGPPIADVGTTLILKLAGTNELRSGVKPTLKSVWNKLVEVIP